MRGMSFKHIVRDREKVTLTVVGFDFGAMENEDGMPLLVGKDQTH